jgi:hypothetical protein
MRLRGLQSAVQLSDNSGLTNPGRSSQQHDTGGGHISGDDALQASHQVLYQCLMTYAEENIIHGIKAREDGQRSPQLELIQRSNHW